MAMALKSKLSRLLTAGNLALSDPPLDHAALTVDQFQLGQTDKIPHMVGAEPVNDFETVTITIY